MKMIQVWKLLKVTNSVWLATHCYSLNKRLVHPIMKVAQIKTSGTLLWVLIKWHPGICWPVLPPCVHADTAFIPFSRRTLKCRPHGRPSLTSGDSSLLRKVQLGAIQAISPPWEKCFIFCFHFPFLCQILHFFLLWFHFLKHILILLKSLENNNQSLIYSSSNYS